MPGLDRQMDPVTKDYIDDGAGGLKTTRTAATACHHQILGDLDAWVGDPEAGSAVTRIPRKDTEGNALAMRDAVEGALRPLAAAAIVAGVEVRVERPAIGRRVIVASAQDIQAGELDLSPLVPYGG